MNKSLFNRLTFLATTAFLAAMVTVCLAIAFYWFNFIVPSIRASEQTRAEMVMVQVANVLEPELDKQNRTGLEDKLVRLLLMQDPTTGENLILGIRLETIDGTVLTHYADQPLAISGPFALSAPLYSAASQEVLGEVSFLYNPHFYEMLVDDARTKMFWLLGLMAGVIFLLQRVLLRLLKPLTWLNQSLKKIDTHASARLPEIKGRVVSEINEVIQSTKDLLARLDSARESERRVRAELVQAQSVSHTGSWVWGIEANEVYWSDEVFRIFGFQPQQFEVTYERFINNVHPDDVTMVEEALSKAVAGEEEYDIVHRVIRPDGTIRFVREKSEVTFNEKGKAIKMIGTVQDITEQKLAEGLSLRLGRIMDEAFNEIYIIDQETFKFIQVNQSARRNMQYTAEEMSAMTPADINPDYTLEQLKAMLQPLMDGTESLLVVQAAHQRKDETVYPVEVRIQLSKHETPPKIVAIVQDITERQKAEQAVQQAMQTLEKRVQERTADLERLTRENELILDAAGEGICGIDKDGLITFVNPAAQEILGYSQKELVGQLHHDIWHHKRFDGSIYPQHESPIFMTLQDGLVRDVTNEIFWKKDGTAVPVEYVSTPIRDEGEVVGAVVTFKDITERKKAEEELQVSEKRFRELFSTNPDAILIMEADTRKILEVNPAALELYGYTREEFLNLTGKDISAEPEKTASAMKEVDEGKMNRISLRYHKKRDGTRFPLEIAGGAFTLNDKKLVFGIIRDISERKKTEQEMILAKEEAERASNAKSQFLSQMSHELRTPLNAILGFGQLMESDPEEPLTEYQQQSVSEILKAGKHLLELINEILDLSRIETGHLTLSVENVNLNYLTEELVTLCAPMAKKNNIELLNYVPLHDDLFVYADRVRLKQVLLNLVSNAIKYNKASGSVKIDATGNKETGIRITVSDTGIGIPEDRLGDLFQPFNRLGSEKTDIEGTGVGLTITKRLVELMNGSIEVDSRVGEGSTFSVTLPWGQPEEESKVLRPTEAAQNPSPLTPRDRWVILYVEDNPASLNLVRQILRRRSDVLLLTAPEAKLGIELAQAHQPDLILLDINLPGMDGLTAFKRLRALKETKITPVVAISANALPRDIKIALDTGFSDYLTKPLDVVEFNRTVEEQLQIRLQRKPSNS